MTPRVLVACEESQAVTIELRRIGIAAWSCDIVPCSGGHPEWHIQGDALDHLEDGWDMLIAHPPCTYLSYAGIGHWNKPGRKEKREAAMQFFMEFVNAPVPRIAVENPLGLPNQAYRKPDQVIHPYMFGDSALKRTCLWLKGLPALEWYPTGGLFPSNAVEPPPPVSIDRNGKLRHWTDAAVRSQRARSKTFPGIARAMADQWGRYLLHIARQAAQS